MRPKKIRAEKVMHTRKGWKHADDVKRLRIMMASVAAAAVVFIAAAGVVITAFMICPLFFVARTSAKRSGNYRVSFRTDFRHGVACI